MYTCEANNGEDAFSNYRILYPFNGPSRKAWIKQRRERERGRKREREIEREREKESERERERE